MNNMNHIDTESKHESAASLGVCYHHILEHVLRLHWRFYDMHILFRLFRAIKL